MSDSAQIVLTADTSQIKQAAVDLAGLATAGKTTSESMAGTEKAMGLSGAAARSMA